MERHLYIIGNGFDLHHGINSSYRNFRDWLYENEPTVIQDIEEAYGCCDDEWWSDFENQLGSLDILEYASAVASENVPDLMSDHCDRMWNDAQIEVEQSLDGLYSDLRSCFRNWILQLNSPREDKKIELIREGSRFLTFNYSKTLENMYGVPSAQILHIHGCIDDNEEFVLGHCVGEDELRKMIIVNDPEPPSDDDPEAYEQWRMEMEDNHQLHQQLAEDAAVSGVASHPTTVSRTSIISSVARSVRRSCWITFSTASTVWGRKGWRCAVWTMRARCRRGTCSMLSAFTPIRRPTPNIS